MSETITLSFTNANPTLVLFPVGPEQAPIAFAQVLIGAKGDDGSLGNVDDIGGFTTDPLFYYILASN